MSYASFFLSLLSCFFSFRFFLFLCVSSVSLSFPGASSEFHLLLQVLLLPRLLHLSSLLSPSSDLPPSLLYVSCKHINPAPPTHSTCYHRYCFDSFTQAAPLFSSLSPSPYFLNQARCFSLLGVWGAGKELQGEEVVDGKEEASRGRLACRIEGPTLARDAALLLARAASIDWAVVVCRRGWCGSSWCRAGEGGEVKNCPCFAMQPPLLPPATAFAMSAMITHPHADLCDVVWCGVVLCSKLARSALNEATTCWPRPEAKHLSHLACRQQDLV